MNSKIFSIVNTSQIWQTNDRLMSREQGSGNIVRLHNLPAEESKRDLGKEDKKSEEGIYILKKV